MARVNLAGVPNLKEALRYARQLGLEVRPVALRSGEIRVTDPISGKAVITSSQRQSTSRALRRLLEDATAARRPTPHELWMQSDGDRDKYLRLMRKHGHLIKGKRPPERTSSATARGAIPMANTKPDPARYDGPAGALRRMADQLQTDIQDAQDEAESFERRARKRHETVQQKQTALSEIKAAIARLDEASAPPVGRQPAELS